MVAGSGKIGTLVAVLLAATEDYHVHLIDIAHQSLNLAHGQYALTQHVLDVNDHSALSTYVTQHGIKTVVSCLPYFCNQAIATLAAKHHLHYFDLTEDTNVFDAIEQLALQATHAFVPQCGVAPGFINIVTNDLIKRFNPVKSALLRVGALPAYPHNALKYALTWSTDGLINEYGNPCYGIKDFQQVTMSPLEDLETITIDGVEYEAFNTSGGVGHLTHAYQGTVETMNYKTLRYPGHCEKMRLLMNDLKLNKDRANLKHILEEALPKTNQDVVIIYAAVDGMQHGEYMEETFVKKIYPKSFAGRMWSAIQTATATSACAVIDIVHKTPDLQKGLILQESIPLDTFFKNRFGQFYL
ncbi:MAG: saccharopine dehydrogenase NADP-binding domain-containing protein [Proteobacteria bacterium]|nr:saccharopine dehydrogenase NADP-binding domain-containing protein [Pseudomonadota bacterium]